MRHVLCAAVFSLLFLLLAPSIAAAAGDTVIYSGVGKDRAKSAVQAMTGTSISEDSLQALLNLILPVDDKIWFIGASTTAECVQGTTAVAEDFDLWIELAETAMNEMDFDAARVVFADLTGGIPCAKDVLTKEQLSNITMLFGVLEAWDGHEEAALERFRQSVMHLGRPEWNTDYPPIVKRVYDQAASEVESLGRITIHYLLSDLNVSELVIDGTSLFDGSRLKGAIRVLPGEHVIQWREGDMELRTHVVQVPREAYLVSTSGMQELLAQRPDGGAATMVQESFLARQDGKVSILVWDEEEDKPAFFYRYDRTKAESIHYLAGAPQDLTMRQRVAHFGAIGFNVAGGYIYHGVSGINVTLSVDFRLKKFFLLQMGGDFSFTTYLGLTPKDNRTHVQPAIRAGVKLELRPERLVKPYVLLLARAGFSGDASPHIGPAVGGGINFTFAKDLAVTVEVVGGPRFLTGQSVSGYVQILVGLTFRRARWE